MTGKDTEKGIRSANIHVIGICNYRCQHCFDRCLTHEYMTPEGWMPVLDYLKKEGVEKINIAGGEPFLYPHLDEMCVMLKKMWFKVSIVSNGSRITEQRISELSPYIDWLGLSIDSPDEEDEILIGRHVPGNDHLEHVRSVAEAAHRHSVKVKLNITAVKRSIGKDFGPFIKTIQPDRKSVV